MLAIAAAGLILGGLQGAASQPLQNPGLVEHGVFPDRTYDSSIPTPTDFLGYRLGEFHTSYSPMVRYFTRLSEISDRILFDIYGKTYEHRFLYYAVISSPDNMARLEGIRENLAQLADPRQVSDEEAAEIVASTPAVVFFNYGTDGNETAAFEAAIQTTYQLVAGTDASTRRLLDDLVVIVTPSMNPDSHERFVAWFNAFQVGREGTADPNAAEHNAPWGMRTNNNHYQIDVNRDSVWNTQVENRALLALYRRWNPQVFVDHHGEYPGFTGPWMVEPLHEQLTANQRGWIRDYGVAMSEIFEANGYRYSPWEYGQFDPGYWDTLPNFTGAIAFTLETTGGGSRGLRRGVAGGPIYTLKEGTVQHMIADESVLRLTAARREEKLRDFLEYKRSAIEEGREHRVEAYVLSADNDPERLDTVVNMLWRDGIEVFRTTADAHVPRAVPYFETGADVGLGSGEAGVAPSRPVLLTRFLPAGSYVAPMAQPESRLLRVLMEPRAEFSREFLDQVEEDQRLRERPGHFSGAGFYDITSWSLPFSYGLKAYEAEELGEIPMGVVAGPVRLRSQLIDGGSYAYLIDYRSNHAIKAIGWLRAAEIVAHVATRSFTIGERRFDPGTVVVFEGQNVGRELHQFMRDLASQTGATVVSVAGALVDDGPHLGSSSYVPMRTERIAVAMDRPVRPASYGAVWFLFEQRYDVTFTAINFERLASVDLSEYGVLVLPDGRYAGAREAIVAKLRDWVSAGGTLIGIKGAAAWLASDAVGITDARTMREVPGGSEDEPGRPIRTIPGAVLRGEVYPNNYLSFGYEAEVPVTVWSNTPLVAGPSSRVAVSFAETERALVGGFAFPDSLESYAGTSYLLETPHGRGHVVLFADDPNFRVTWDSLTRFFFNAVFFSNSF